MKLTEKYLNEGIEMFSKGDIVRELPNGPFGNKEDGKIIKVNSRYSWNVKFPGDKKTYEYQSGELFLVKNGWTVIRVWRIKAPSNTDAIEMTKTLSHDEVIVKKGKIKVK